VHGMKPEPRRRRLRPKLSAALTSASP
jgi:hypothetical protein